MAIKEAGEKNGREVEVYALGLNQEDRPKEKGPWRREAEPKDRHDSDYSPEKESYRVSTKPDRANAKEAIAKYKDLGRQIGEDIKQEGEKKGLEKKVLGIAAISGLVLSLFFMSNITGNVIGTHQTSSRLA